MMSKVYNMEEQSKKNKHQNMSRILDAALLVIRKLKYFENEKLTNEELETISKIRDELTRIAGPEDIMSVKIIKKNISASAREHMLEYIRVCNTKPTCMGLIYKEFSLPCDVILDLWNECKFEDTDFRIGMPEDMKQKYGYYEKKYLDENSLSRKSLKKHIILSTESIDETYKLLNTIDQQLINNKDYLNDNIKISGNDHELHVYIYKECENIPEIILKMSSK